MEKMDNQHKSLYNHFRMKFKLPEGRRVPIKKVGGRPGKEQSIWAISVTIVSFILSLSILFVSTGLFEKISPYWSFIVVLIIIMVGVLFDLIGIAVTAAEEKPFHAMASKKYPGARQAIKLIRNADKVSSICNDVVGDICGVVSGTAGAAIIFRVFTNHTQPGWVEAAVGGLIAAITVGGKAFAKKFGMNNSHFIVYRVGTILALFTPSNGKK
jgi:hypothetical protein